MTQQFAGLRQYLHPSRPGGGRTRRYNANNPPRIRPATWARPTFPRHEGDTGSSRPTGPASAHARIVPDYISLFPQSQAGRAVRRRDAPPLRSQGSHARTIRLRRWPKFYVFTSTHIAGHFTGVITDDFTSEFDPFSPQFGEKFSPPNLPVRSMRDFTGNEVARVYSDQWGVYNGLTYSTWEVNPPNPTGYAPTDGPSPA